MGSEAAAPIPAPGGPGTSGAAPRLSQGLDLGREGRMRLRGRRGWHRAAPFPQPCCPLPPPRARCRPGSGHGAPRAPQGCPAAGTPPASSPFRCLGQAGHQQFPAAAAPGAAPGVSLLLSARAVNRDLFIADTPGAERSLCAALGRGGSYGEASPELRVLSKALRACPARAGAGHGGRISR